MVKRAVKGRTLKNFATERAPDGSGEAEAGKEFQEARAKGMPRRRLQQGWAVRLALHGGPFNGPELRVLLQEGAIEEFPAGRIDAYIRNFVPLRSAETVFFSQTDIIAQSKVSGPVRRRKRTVIASFHQGDADQHSEYIGLLPRFN